MEFTKCQGCQLLTSIPAAARATLHHFEVAAVLQPFQARPPLDASATGRQQQVPAKTFVHVVVTDWSLLLVSLPSSQHAPAALLELPLLLIGYTVSACLCVPAQTASTLLTTQAHHSHNCFCLPAA